MHKWKRKCYFLLTVSVLLSPLSAFAATSDNESQNDILKTPTNFPDLTNLEIGQYLGWVEDPTCVDSCGGYYAQQPINFDGKSNGHTDAEHAPVTLSAGFSDYHFVGRSIFKNNVIATQPGRQIIADVAYTYRSKDGTLDRINMLGNVHFREPGKLIIADTAYVPLRAGTSEFDLYDVIYRISLKDAQKKQATKTTSKQGKDADGVVKDTSLTAWGTADHMHKPPETKKIALSHATYSTCPPKAGSCAWHLYSNYIVLDDETGRGHADNSVLWLKKVPVFYMPYISFPINDQRQSGFLFPSFFSSSNSGFGTALPYYFNLAPNYDLTMTPNFYTERGVLLNSEFRYLTHNSTGAVTFGIIPNDSKFGSFQEDAKTDYADSDSLSDLENANDTRTSFRWVNNSTLNDFWTSKVDFNYVSDDYYTEDFAGSFNKASSDQLLRQGQVSYFGPGWNFSGLLQSYQTLHPVDEDDIDNQYARLPELNLTGDFPDQPYGMEYLFNSEFDYFYKEPDPGDTEDPTTGDRANIRPGVSFPMVRSYGYITPTAQLDTTSYQLTNQNQSDSDDNPANPNRVLPMYDIDSGLYFDRDANYFGKGYTQTLEPRLFYLYVPYEDQDDLPDFDTVLTTLDYDQLFQTNRFSSIDRIGDANQLSMGLTSRLIDSKAGYEKVSASIGDIWYFRNRDVRLCTTDDCIERDRQEFSPVVGKLDYHLNPVWSVVSDMSYNTSQALFENGSLTFQYKPGRNKVINWGYSYVYEGNVYTTDDDDEDDELVNLSQIHFSYAWPVTQQWSTLGGVDLDTRYGNGASYLLGLQYSSCCWGTRLIIDRSITGVQNDENQYDNTVYLQFILKGFSTINSSDPTGLLTSNIAGYKDDFNQRVI